MLTRTTPLQDLAARQSAYVDALHASFFRKLSRQDCEDAVAEAFLAASVSKKCPELDVVQLDLWLRRAVRSKALDTLKTPDREGQGAVVRQAALDIDDFLDLAVDTDDDDTRDQDVAAVLTAFGRLSPRNQKVLCLRHLDSLDRDTCARLLGISVTKFKRYHTEAARRLTDLIIGTLPHDTCAQARALINLSGSELLDVESTARRDAHLAGCTHCRQYQRRSRGLLAFLPLPAITLSDRFAARLHTLIERFMPVAHTTDAATTAAGGAAVFGAGGAKLAVIAAASVAAVGGGAVVAGQLPHRQAHRAPTTTAVQARLATAATVAPTATSPNQAAAARRSASSVPRTVAQAKARARARAKAAAAHRRDAGASLASAELKPPGHEVAIPASTVASTPEPIPAHAAATSSSSATHRSDPVAVPSTTQADSTSGEFAPHP